MSLSPLLCVNFLWISVHLLCKAWACCAANYRLSASEGVRIESPRTSISLPPSRFGFSVSPVLSHVSPQVRLSKLSSEKPFIRQNPAELTRPSPGSHISLSPCRSIIAPSVLASDMGNLSHECKRVMNEGADWLHMGKRELVALANGFWALTSLSSG